MIIVNAQRAVDDEKDWVFMTIDDVDGDECRYTSVVPWNGDVPTKLTGQALTDYCNAKEDRYKVEIMKGMYPGARYTIAGGQTELEAFENWSIAHTNTAYCSISGHATEQDCLDAGGKWTPEEVITKVPFEDSHEYTGDQKQRKLESVRAGAMEQIEDVAGYPQWFQANVSNGVYPSATGDTMTAYIALVITESNRCEDLIEAAETIDEALNVTPDWPEV